jgi:hypothetical protein
MIRFLESFAGLDSSADSDGYILGRWTTWSPYVGESSSPSSYLAADGATGQVAFLKQTGFIGVFQGGLGITIPISAGQTSVVVGAYIREREPEFAVKGIVNIDVTMPLFFDPNHPDQHTDLMHFTNARYSLQSTTGYGLIVNLSGGSLASLVNAGFGWGLTVISAPPLPAGIIQQNKWHFVEMKLDWGGSTGISGALHLDGLETLPPTLAADGSGNFLGIRAPTQLDISFNGTDFGGVYISDNLPSGDSAVATDFIGEITQLALSPTADGTHGDWTPDTGTDHFARIVPPPDGDASYVYSETPGAIDTYKFSLPAGGTKTIYQVAVNNDARQIGNGVRQIAAICVSGATVATGPAGASLTTTYKPNTARFDVDPATGAPWTESGLAAAEFGVTLAS